MSVPGGRPCYARIVVDGAVPHLCVRSPGHDGLHRCVHGFEWDDTGLIHQRPGHMPYREE